MDQKRVSIAARADRKRLPGADGDDMNVDPARRSKQGQDMAEQPGILGRGRRAQRDEALLSLGRTPAKNQKEKRQDSDHCAPPCLM
jgi:hypothetical protein